MATYTEHYNLKKPANSENYNVEDANSNNDILDKILFGKQDKIPNKGLSTNDFTDEYKKKLDSLNNYDDTDIKDGIKNVVGRTETLEEDNKTNKEDISNLKKQDISQNELIEQLQKRNALLESQIPTGQVEGENISIKDISDLPFKEINICGNNCQNTSQILPEGYTQIDYIEATGTQYIDTGYLPKDTSKYEFLGTIVENPTTIKGAYIFGENDEGDSTPEEQWYHSCYIKLNSKGGIQFSFGHDENGNAINLSAVSGYIGSKHKLVLDKEGACIDNTLIGNFAETTTPFTKGKSLYLFALHYTDTDDSDVAELGVAVIQVNNFKIYEDNILKHDFIPCKRNSDNVLGLYDYITKEFKTNAGTGTFNGGEVSILPNEDYQIPSLYYPSEVRACGDNINFLTINQKSQKMNGLDFIINTNGSIRINGTSTAKTTLYFNPDILKLKAGNYFLGNGTTDIMLGFQIDNTYYNTNGNRVITLQDTANNKLMQSYIQIESGKTIDNVTIYPMIKKGSSALYSPPGQGNMTIVKSNKNLFDKESDILSKRYFGKNGQIEVATANDAFLQEKYIRVSPNIKLTFSGGIYIRVCEYDKYKNFIKITNSNTQNKLTIESNNETKFIRVSFNGNINEFQIEEGESATEYIENQGKTYIVPTQQPFYKGDTFVKIDGVRYEKHNFKRHILNGTENIILSGSVNGIYQFNITVDDLKIASEINYKNDVLSNGFGSINYWTNSWLVDNVVLPIVKEKKIRFQTSKYIATEEFKTELAEQHSNGTPIYIVYPLAEPIFIPCTEDQNAILDEIEQDENYKNITHIYSEDEISSTFNVEYYKDLETMFNNLNTAIVSLGGV